jgi:hypothetical protein
MFGQAYILYECDNVGISCRAVYRYKPNSLDAVSADFDNPPRIEVVEQNIIVTIGGEDVYAHPVSP